jgi:sterol desaturase/sphingolipid hydroxylase (fatty acid hydroxylase superfamily)
MPSETFVQDPSLSQLALTMLTVDFLRYALAAGAVWLVVEVILGRRLAGRRILDATHAPGQVRREITYSLATVVIFAANGLLVWLMALTGRVEIYADVATRGWPWWWLSLLVIIVAHDAYFYWTHRWLHQRRWFRAVHGRHHASLHPTPWAAYAFHPVEALVQAAFLPLFLLGVPVHGAVIALFLMHMILRNTIGHCAHELLPWRWTPRGWLGWVTPVSHHHFHHARNRGNFGLYFTWWDRWCSTEDADYLHHGDTRFAHAATPTGSKVVA